MERRAKVESTLLDINLGMAAIYLTISGDGIPTQKFGGTFCSKPLEIIGNMLDICNAASWEDMPGKEILVSVEDGKVTYIKRLDHTIMIRSFEHVTISDIVKFKER